MGKAMIPPGLLFGMGLLSADEQGQIFSKWPPPEKGRVMKIPKSFASNVLSSQQAIYTPAFPGGPPRTTARSHPDSYGDPTFPWDSVHTKVCEHLPKMGFPPPPPVPWSNCTQAPPAFNATCSGGSIFQCQIPTCGSLMWGSELSPL